MENDSLAAIFEIYGKGYDVILTSKSIKWTPLNGKWHGGKIDKIVRQNRSFQNDSSSEGFLHMNEIIGAKVKRFQKEGQTEEKSGICLGLDVYVANLSSDSIHYAVDVILFAHPSHEITNRWCQRIDQLLASRFPERPRSLKIFIRPLSGRRNARHVYDTEVKPLLQAAFIRLDVTEIPDIKDIQKEIDNVSLTDHDSVVCVGGDGSLNKIASALLTRTQQDGGVEFEDGDPPRRCCFPIGIIPTGTFNLVAHSVLATTDLVTAAVHIILGNRQLIDICSVWKSNRFFCWAFNSHFGFFGNILKTFDKFALLGEKRIEASIAWSLKKRKHLRAYCCDIQYKPISNPTCTSPKDGVYCRRNCLVCDSVQTNVTFDDVHSINSEADTQLSDNPDSAVNSLELIRGNVANISVFSLPSLNKHAPLGLSQFTHLNDGCLDLVVLKNIENNSESKQFVKFIRRLGGRKNQLDLPIVATHRCSEVRCQVSFQNSETIEDDVSELDQQNGNKSSKINSGLDDLDLNSSESETATDEELRVTVESSRDPVEDSATVESSRDPVGDPEPSTSTNFRERISKLLTGGRNKIGGAVGKVTRLNLFRRGNDDDHQSGKVTDRSRREERRMDSSPRWNIDNESHEAMDLIFRAHKGLVVVHGLGIPQEYDPVELKMNCLAPFAK